MLRSILRWSAGTIGVLALIVVVYAMSLQPHAPPLRGDVDSDFAGGGVPGSATVPRTGIASRSLTWSPTLACSSIRR